MVGMEPVIGLADWLAGLSGRWVGWLVLQISLEGVPRLLSSLSSHCSEGFGSRFACNDFSAASKQPVPLGILCPEEYNESVVRTETCDQMKIFGEYLALPRCASHIVKCAQRHCCHPMPGQPVQSIVIITMRVVIIIIKSLSQQRITLSYLSSR